jgi:hypothetical protein
MTTEKKDEMLDVVEIHERVRKFLTEQYPGSTAFFTAVKLTTVGNITAYEVKGELTIGGGEVAKPTKKSFTVHVHPTQGKILGYKM